MVIDVIAAIVAAFFTASEGQTTVTPRMADFDLAKVVPKVATCANRGQSDEIIVCAPKGMDIWIADAGKFAAKPLRGEFQGPLNSQTTLHVIQSPSPVAVTPAAAVTFKWKF